MCDNFMECCVHFQNQIRRHGMSEFYEVEIEASVDPHVHPREMEKKTMCPLVNTLIMGGCDVMAPMPNTEEGLTVAAKVIKYKKFVEKMIPHHEPVKVLPIVMINEQTTQKMIDECIADNILDGKVYPLNKTTQSHYGVKHYGRLLPIMKHCGKVGMRRHLHPEHPSVYFDNRDAEFAFLPILEMFLDETEGVIISEHGTDGRCIPHWQAMAKSERFFVTLTPHHLLTDESNSYGDVRKTFKPPVKTIVDRCSLVRLVEEDYPWVMAGSDFAPHDISAKHVHQGRCACGAYHGKFILPFYAHALDRLLLAPKGIKTFVNFTSRNSRKLYNLLPASRKIKLVRKSQKIPLYDKVGPWTVELFMAGETILWQLA